MSRKTSRVSNRLSRAERVTSKGAARSDVRFNRRVVTRVGWCLFAILSAVQIIALAEPEFGSWAGTARAQDQPRDAGAGAGNEAGGLNGPADLVENGVGGDRRSNAYLIDVRLPLGDAEAERLSSVIRELSGRLDPAARQRQPVVLRFGGSEFKGNGADGQGSTFEDSLAVARLLSSKAARGMRTIAYLAGPVRGHAVLPVLNCDELVVGREASLGDATLDESEVDPSVLVVYRAIASGRGVFPEAAVTAMVDPAAVLYRVSQVDGTAQFAGRERLEELRASGVAWQEEQLATSDATVEFTGEQLRRYRWASQLVEDPKSLNGRLGVRDLVTVGDGEAGELRGRRFDLRGSIVQRRVERFESNLVAAVDDVNVNALLVVLDSPGGSLDSSLQLGLTLGDGQTGIKRTIGFVAGEARGDAVLIAAACRPLYLHPDARLGGPGGEALDHAQVEAVLPAIEVLAAQSGRSGALLLALLDPEVDVFRYRNRRTGELAYFTGEMVREGLPREWSDGEPIDLREGISAAEAVELGLAEEIVESAEVAATRGGLAVLPETLADRPLVQWVERLGALPILPGLLIFIGTMTLSIEVSAPGLGVPGFVSLVCFVLFFWMKFLSGTAEWLEVMLFVTGVMCLLVEVLLIPGTGVFGFGGILMVVAAIVLTSQTFVLPQNDYQYQQMTRGLGTVALAFLGIIGGIIALRYALPGTPVFRRLVMPGPRSEEMLEQVEREHIVRLDWLLGHEGVAVTPLRPGGKARFGEEVFGVVSDGTPLATGAGVRVVEVLGNRIVVQAIEDASAPALKPRK